MMKICLRSPIPVPKAMSEGTESAASGRATSVSMFPAGSMRTIFPWMFTATYRLSRPDRLETVRTLLESRLQGMDRPTTR